MTVISIEDWATREKVMIRTAYRWADSGKLPTVPRKKVLELIGVESDVTKEGVVN